MISSPTVKEFYTFRVFALHYWNEFLAFFKKLENIRVYVPQLEIARGIKIPTGIHFAIAFDAAANDNGGSATSPITWSHTCTGSNLIIQCGNFSGSDGANDVTAVSFNSVALSQTVKETTSTFRRGEIWSLLGPATGSHTVSLTFTGGGFAAGCSASYTGVGGTGATNTGKSTGTTDLTVALTTTVNNSWGTMSGRVASGTPGNGGSTTNRTADSAGLPFGDRGPLSPTGSYNLDATSGTSVDMSQCVCELTPVAAGGGAVAQAIHRLTLMGIGI